MNNRKKHDQVFWKFVRSYLIVYMPKIRCLSPKTIESYSQSISQYCLFLKERFKIEFSKVTFEHITRESVKEFIQWLCVERNCGFSTCNLRLSALKSFLKYCSDEDITLYSIYLEIKRIPLMKGSQTPVGYMSDAAIKVLLAQPDIKTTKGARNLMIMILMYDTGVRVQELVDICVYDLHLMAKNAFITVNGKGNRTRNVPLMDKTVAHLKEYLRRYHTTSSIKDRIPLFYSLHSGKPQMLSTDTIGVLLNNYGEKARTICSEVPPKVHAHLIRHSRAMALYRSGIPLSYIAEFLGHVSINTTTIYASADVEMLREAIYQTNPDCLSVMPKWKEEETLRTLCGL